MAILEVDAENLSAAHVGLYIELRVGMSLPDGTPRDVHLIGAITRILHEAHPRDTSEQVLTAVTVDVMGTPVEVPLPMGDYRLADMLEELEPERTPSV